VSPALKVITLVTGCNLLDSNGVCIVPTECMSCVHFLRTEIMSVNNTHRLVFIITVVCLL